MIKRFFIALLNILMMDIRDLLPKARTVTKKISGRPTPNCLEVTLPINQAISDALLQVESDSYDNLSSMKRTAKRVEYGINEYNKYINVKRARR